MSESTDRNMTQEDLLTGGMRFDLWLERVGVSRPEGYRMRELGMIKAHRVGRKLFVAQDDISLFWVRVKAGEFAKELAGVCTPEGMAKAKKTKAAKRLKKWKAPTSQNN